MAATVRAASPHFRMHCRSTSNQRSLCAVLNRVLTPSHLREVNSSKVEEVYILKECPPAQSIGKTVMDKGYMFIWDPREQVPYLIPPSIVPKCRLRIPRKHRICASTVVEYVPQYDEKVKPIRFVPPERLQPLGAIDATPAETTPDPVSDEEYTPSVAADDVSEPVESVEDASPRSSAVGSETAEAFAGGIPPHPDDDKTPIELAYDGDEARIADDLTMLKKAAFEEPHILTTLSQEFLLSSLSDLEVNF